MNESDLAADHRHDARLDARVEISRRSGWIRGGGANDRYRN